MRECIEFGRKHGAKVTAVCDIWNLRRDMARDRLKDLSGSEPKVYKNIEALLNDKEIDAVIIATADHQHAKMLKMAVEAGKDVYCEKPMANVLEEANAALDAVKKSEQIVQIGTQRRSFAKYRQAQKIMRGNPLGEIVKVEMISNAYSPYRWAARETDLASLKQSDVDWPAFLMGKQSRPFDPRIYRSFRLFRDFSSGIIDQWMTHMIDAVHMLTGERYPTSAVAQGGIYAFHDYRENPDTISVALEYGEAKQTQTPNKKHLVTYSVSLANEFGSSSRIMGRRGTLEFERTWRISGEGVNAKDRIPKAEEIADDPEAIHHMANWLDCVRRRDSQGLYCPVEAGYGHSIACIMSTDALWSGRRTRFNPKDRSIQTT
jgi:predicted dehydrogenase